MAVVTLLQYYPVAHLKNEVIKNKKANHFNKWADVVKAWEIDDPCGFSA